MRQAMYYTTIYLQLTMSSQQFMYSAWQGRACQ